MRVSKKFWVSLCALSLFWSSESLAASATGAVQAKRAAQKAAAEKLDSGVTSGQGTDLRAIRSSNPAPTTFTGLPAGTLPGDRKSGNSNTNEEQPGHIALVGKPLMPAISEANIGNGMNQIGVIADQIGYKLVPRKNYKATSPADPPYSMFLMKGDKLIRTLFFDCQLKLCDIR